jgi:hypothetical protein
MVEGFMIVVYCIGMVRAECELLCKVFIENRHRHFLM